MLLIGVLYFAFDTLLQAGFFKSIQNKTPGSVEQVYRGTWGPEDMDVDYDQGIVYISSANRWKKLAGKESMDDGIYNMKPNSNLGPKKMAVIGLDHIQPHGISFFRQDSFSYLFVVNHYDGKHTVELLRINGDTLNHQKTFKNELMHAPNDVTARSVSEFYVSNDHGNSSETGKRVEEYLRMPYSYVLHYKDGKFKKVLEGLVYANGVNYSSDGNQLYVTQTIGHELQICDIDKKNGFLKVQETISIPSGLDNIHVDETGNMWIGSHPKLFDFSGQVKDSSKVSPSQVFMVSQHEKEWRYELILEDDGDIISASTVAVTMDNSLYVGGWGQDKVIKMGLR